MICTFLNENESKVDLKRISRASPFMLLLSALKFYNSDIIIIFTMCDVIVTTFQNICPILTSE